MTQTNSIAISILLGFVMVAGAIVYDGNQSRDDVLATRGENRALYGSKKADITIVEFSDYQCPFCSRVHPIIKKIVDESDGKINWEFRHMPLPSHSSAEIASITAECVLRKVSNKSFWEYTDVLLSNQRNVNPTFVKETAFKLGLSDDDYTSCLEDDSIAAQISDDVIVAQHYGGRGTPFSVVVFGDGTHEAVSGALPYEQWQQVLNR